VWNLVSYRGKKIGWGVSRTGFWRKRLDLRVRNLQETEENYTIRSFMLYYSKFHVIKWRGMREADKVTCIGERDKKCLYGFGGETRSMFMFIFNYALQPLKVFCAILVRRSNFRHLASPRVSPRERPQRRKVKLWARNVREFCLNADVHVTFRDLLHAVKLRHGTDGFTSPPKEGVLKIVSPQNNPTRKLGYQRPARYL